MNIIHVRSFKEIKKEAEKGFIKTGDDNIDARMNLAYFLGMIEVEYNHLYELVEEKK